MANSCNIDAKTMHEAVFRWAEFNAVNPTGFPPDLTLIEGSATFDHKFKARRLAQLAKAKSVGISRDALDQFYGSFGVFTREMPEDVAQALRDAAELGLLVGLEAQRLANEKEGSDHGRSDSAPVRG